MKKNEKAILKLIQQDNNSITKLILFKKASILNIDGIEFEKIFDRLLWRGYVRMLGQNVELTDKGINHLG